MKQLTFATMWGWALENTNRLTYSSEIELFELMFAQYCEDEDKHYNASRISCYKSGREHLPRKMVSRYWLAPDYAADLEDAVLTVLSSRLTTSQMGYRSIEGSSSAIIWRRSSIAAALRRWILSCLPSTQTRHPA